MIPESKWFPSYQKLAPISIIPAITYLDQLHIIYSNLNLLINDSNYKKWELLISVKKQLMDKKFSDSSNRVKLSDKNEYYWNYDKFSFFFLQYYSEELFRKNGVKILQIIRNELESNSTKWIFANCRNQTYIFTLSSNHYFIWSPIISGLEFLIQALIILDSTLLDSLTDIDRWEKLENGKKNISHIWRLWLDNNEIKNLYYQNNLRFRNFMPLQTLMEIQEIILSELQSIVNKSVKSKLEIDPKSIFNQSLNLNSNFISNGAIHGDNKDSLKVKNEKQLIESFIQNLTQMNIKNILDIYPLNILEINPQFNPTTDHQRTGSYYTPIALAEILVKQSFEELIQITNNKSKNIFNVFDPAMGTGIILLYSLEWILNYIMKTNGVLLQNNFMQSRQEILRQCIFGSDIDEEAVIIGIDYLQLFCENDSNNKGSFLNFKTENLFESFTSQAHEILIPEKFDIILTNPPYLALHSRFAKYPITRNELKSLQQVIPEFSGNRDNIYLLFLGICLKYLTQSNYGVVGFVIDRSFLDLSSYKEIRRNLLQNYHLSYLLADYNYKRAVVDLALIVFSHDKNSTRKTIWQKSLSTKEISITKNHFNTLPNCVFLFQQDFEILTQIQEKSISLGEICTISCGVEYGSLLKTHFLSNKPKYGFFPVIDGSNGLPHSYILFWVPDYPNSYVRFDKVYEKKLISRKRNVSKTNRKVLLISGVKERFLSPKIFIRQTASRFIATYDSDKYFGLRNLHLIYAVKPPYSLLFILGILNSSLGSFIGEKLNIIRKGGSNRYPQIRINELKAFPIRSLDQLTEEEELWKEKIEENVKNCINLGNNISSILVFIWNRVHLNFKSQRHFLQVILNNTLSNCLSLKEIQKLSNKLQELEVLLDQLKICQELVNDSIIKIYNVKKRYY
ncbi:MAG: Eco57I restriction-modification methylase domain-containing protein [Candidatus Hodarchaeota archaeon]